MVPPHAFAFSVDLTSSVRGPMGVHWSCAASVGLLCSWGFLRREGRVWDLCSYAHFLFVCFGFGFFFCVCVCTQRSSIFRKPHFTFRLHIYPVPKYKQVHKLFKLTNRFETFTSLAVLCTPCWEKRKMGYILNWMQRGDFAEGACAHLGIGELLKDVNAGRTAESAFLVPANCWHHLLPLWLRCTSTCKPFESCYHLLFFKYITTCELHLQGRSLFKSMHLERLYNILIVNVSISDLVSCDASVFVICLIFCVHFCCLLSSGVQKEKKLISVYKRAIYYKLCPRFPVKLEDWARFYCTH